ncbi:MAG: tRNA (N6-isopentenyl adenosine(37)-C2)-methylthiotransferase MiaB [Clostridia bacterium]|nr:tRNA (N6-isopentenyl adenosine(37)-C2)-methylthiotransferase MiaB [Clostridia bacterium]
MLKTDERFAKRAPKYYILTLGCQQNEADSERIAGLCALMGYTASDDPNDASIIFVNTCAIREHAETRAISFIGEYKHIKERDPSVIIAVGGCMVTQPHIAEKIKHNIPYVSFTFDTGSLYKIPELVLGALAGKRRRFDTDGEFLIAEGIPSVRKVSHSAWLSIMYGCNNFCSYCIVPYVRGRERSRRINDILEEAKRLISSGAKEITLLGQNVNSYGKDTAEGKDFADLIKMICRLDGDFRLKFMTSHPKDASDKLIAAMAEEEKMAKHFHLPVQSGSDDILKRMNRHYDVGRYMSIVEKLKSAVPDVSITSDIIVAFPGETEDDFEATLDLIKEVRFDALFSFIFSPRTGTPAAKMDGQIPKEVSRERFARLLDVANPISLERNSRFLGRTVRALAEEVSKDNGLITGRGDSPRPIHFAADKGVIGNFVNVRITKAETFSMNGEIQK